MPVSVLAAQMSSQEVTEWVEFLKIRAESKEAPEQAPTSDWRVMKDRFLRVKELQQMQGKRVTERK